MAKEARLYDIYINRLFGLFLTKNLYGLMKALMPKLFSKIFLINLSEGADLYPHLLINLISHDF
mgnify:CR=1 FL=1